MSKLVYVVKKYKIKKFYVYAAKHRQELITNYFNLMILNYPHRGRNAHKLPFMKGINYLLMVRELFLLKKKFSLKGNYEY